MGRSRLDAPGHVLRVPGWSDRRRRCISRRRRSPAPRRRFWRPPPPRGQRDPSRRDRTARRRVLRVPAGARRRDRRRRKLDASASVRRRAWTGHDTPCAGDYIEAGSWAVIAAITGRGDRGDRRAHARPRGDRCAPAAHGPGLSLRRRSAERRAFDDPRGAVGSRPACGPGFPSDMVSLVTVLATQAAGRTLVHDWLYELRLFALEQLSAMRADFFLCDPHRIIVTGPTKLRGRALDTRDLRSGMALIAAALAADGESRVSPLETVERGYARLVDRLVSLGAQVEREDRASRGRGDTDPGCPLRPAPAVEDAGVYGRRSADDCARRRRQHRRLRRRPRRAAARIAVSGCRSHGRGD